MVDYGFSAEGADLIDRYFGVMILVVAILALASSARYYLVMTLGERVDDRCPHRCLRAISPGSTPASTTPRNPARSCRGSRPIRRRSSRPSAPAPRSRCAMSSLFVGAVGDDGGHQPAAVRPVLSRSLSSCCRWSHPAVPCASAPALAQDTLADASAFATEAVGAMRMMQAFTAEKGHVAHFAPPWRTRSTPPAPTTLARPILTAVAIFLIFSSVVAVLWFGAQDVLDGNDHRRPAVAVRALRGLRARARSASSRRSGARSAPPRARPAALPRSWRCEPAIKAPGNPTRAP